MISKSLWLLSQATSRLWVRASLFALLGMLSALAAILFKHLVPFDLPAKIGADAVDNILNILAASMLAVTTFSLSVTVSALSAASANVSPRATQLLVRDSTTQNVLATFLGTFLFSLVGIISLSTGAYGDTGRVILFAVTLFVIAVVVITMVRWIDYLTDFGLVSETTSRVERAAAKALTDRAEYPGMGGVPVAGTEAPPSGTAIRPTRIGYIQHVDIARLSELAEEMDARFFLCALPGSFVHHGTPLLRVSKPVDDPTIHSIQSAWTIRQERSFDQDPRFGVIVLSEIAARALSTAINDSGTAIDVTGRLVRLLLEYRATKPNADSVKFPRVHVPTVKTADLLNDGFGPIIRYAATAFEVNIRLQKALAALGSTGDSELAESAASHSARLLELARTSNMAAEELDALRDVTIPWVGP